MLTKHYVHNLYSASGLHLAELDCEIDYDRASEIPTDGVQISAVRVDAINAESMADVPTKDPLYWQISTAVLICDEWVVAAVHDLIENGDYDARAVRDSEYGFR